MADLVKATLPEDIFTGGGEMGRVMRSLDWSKTLLGAVSDWPQSLKTTVSIILNSRYPMFVWWGRELAAIYNDAYRPILGATKHPQFLGNSARDMWAEIWHTLGPLTDIVLSTGEPTWCEDLLLLMDRNGYTEETYFTFSYSPVRDESNGVGGVFCACSETTERIIGERRLRTLRELAANTGEAKSVVEACRITTDTLSNNPEDIPFALLYLVNEDGSQGNLVNTVGIAPGTIASYEQIDLRQNLDPWQIAQVYRTGEAIALEDLVERFGVLPGGAWEASPQAALVLPITRLEKQQQAGWLILGISPRREFDEHYRGFFELITSNVATAIANARAYEEARQKAEALAELDRAKTLFFSNISHELRTPLTLMLSPLEEALALADDTLLVTQRQSLEMVHRNSLRLLKLVNTLLDFSRIEAGRIQAVYEPTNLATFTSELASVFRSAIEQTGMSLVVHCPPLPELVYVDREMWEKIVLNLLSNAFKFTFEGEITVNLQFIGDRIELSVQDTGIGIVSEEIPHLFERFYRVKGSQGRSFEGSGIGLSLVEELVKLHGGTVTVTSVPAEGSCFTVSIPTGYTHLPPDRIGTTRTLTSTASGAVAYLEEALQWLPQGAGSRETNNNQCPMPHSARILLVENNADMRNYVKQLLVSQQYEVETVTDGVAALAAMRQHRPDLVLSDVMMPRMDGFELLRSLRSDPATREIPMIVLSARAGEESRLEGLQAGADDYLIKPFSARELLARIEVNLKLSRLRQEALQREQELRSQSETSQQAAEVAKATLENVLASIKDQFLVLDHEWRYIYVNDRVVEVIGIPRKNLLGKSIWELFPDMVGSEFYTQVHRAVSEPTPVQFEYFYPAWNRWFENRIYPTVNGVSILITEITDRKQAEIALQHSEERYRAFVEQSTEAIWCFETTSPLDINSSEAEQIQHFYEYCYLAECNQVMAQMYGASSPDDLIGARLTDLLVESEPFNLQYLRAFIHSGYRLVDAESYEVDQQGNPKVFLNNLVGIIEDGMLVRAWGTQRDITDRKRAEAALQESENRFRQMAETIQDVFWIVDFDLRRALYISPAYEQIWGRSCESLYHNFEGWMDNIHPDDREMVRMAANQCIQTGSLSIEYRVIRPDGSIRWVRDRGYNLEDESGLTRRIAGIAEDITERKQIAAALQESTAILNAINQTSPTLIFVKDRQGKMLMANPATVQAIGKPEAAIVGKTDFDFHINRAEAEQIVENDRLILETGQLQTFEEIVEVAAGRRTYLSTKSPYRDSQGNIIGLIGISFDISDRKQAEAALRKSEERAHLAIKVGRLGTWSYDPVTNLVELDERMREIWGEPVSAIAPLAIIMERIHPDDQARVARAIGAALDPRSSGTYEIEYRIIWPDGTEHWVLANGQTQFATEGVAKKAIAFTGTALDITERKQAEATLRQSEERYRYLAESIPQLVWTADTNGRMTDVNQRWSEFTGLTLAQAQSEGWQAIVHPDDLPLLTQNWATAQQAGTHYQAEGRMRRADGTYHWHLHQAVPLKNPQGRVIKWFGTATDIEDQKQLDQQRQLLLEQEQAARAQAETANRIKDEFLAVLSHELRSPLNPILGWSRLLLNGKLDATKTTQAVQIIERNAKLQAQLIEDLLDISRILVGKFRLENAPVNLAAIIVAAQETVQLAAQAKSIQIQTVLDPNIEQVLGDAARLQQVIWNLLTNAVKFTNPGGRVEIRLDGVDSHAQIQVTDTGKGIHPDFLPHVFEYFRQEDGATTRKFGGLGLGLAIVRHLVELHGGTVRAASPGEGEGATFTVRLPLLKADKTINNVDNSSPLALDTSPLTGIRVLVVDDETDTRELIAFILEQAGAIVTTAVSAIAALQAIAQTPPDVLVSDIGMPHMDGYMLMQQIRAENSQILAIALTAYAGEMNQQQALSVGFQHHLSKPIDPDQLVQAIINLLKINS
ncbi:PAS domain S-box protein [Calothrix sp. PCC 7507]|uniref:PAS domain S-box protein n=1 Tax=Calothrix sp. PCC 7507 TaxID=99598 RepID=UPI00029F38F7|nr:PAS domain S-box protein [Calothrix sp. PCC 7507]AFY34690.1 PAS/PAC sensor hybrid histidine kinase [Calothrix sp. PCC 7507]